MHMHITPVLKSAPSLQSYEKQSLRQVESQIPVSNTKACDNLGHRFQ